MVINMFILNLATVIIIFVEIPILIKKRLLKELFVYIILLLIGYSCFYMYIAEIDIKHPTIILYEWTKIFLPWFYNFMN